MNKLGSKQNAKPINSISERPATMHPIPRQIRTNKATATKRAQLEIAFKQNDEPKHYQEKKQNMFKQCIAP